MVLDGGVVFTEGTPQTVAREYHQLLFDSDSSRKTTHDLFVQHVEPLGTTDSASLTPESASAQGQSIGPRATVTSAALAGESVGDADAAGTSVREIRYGSKEAEIFEIGIRDEVGTEARVIEVHRAYEFYYKVRFNSDVRNSVGYGFIISNQRGVELFATKARLYDKAMPPSQAGSAY